MESQRIDFDVLSKQQSQKSLKLFLVEGLRRFISSVHSKVDRMTLDDFYVSIMDSVGETIGLRVVGKVNEYMEANDLVTAKDALRSLNKFVLDFEKEVPTI